MNISDCRTHQILVITFVKAEILENLKAMCLPNGGWHLKYIHVKPITRKKNFLTKIKTKNVNLRYSIRNPCQMPSFKICGSKQK